MDIFRKTMSRDCFRNILRSIRFDDKDTRADRLIDDKFAALSEVWQKVMKNFQKYFKPHENLVVDEQVFGMKNRCKFIQYCPEKPEKFGVKFYLLVDSTANYVFDSFPYLGKDSNRPDNMLYGEFVVRKLMKNFYNLGLNVTTDRFFTNDILGDFLISKNSTLVGTCRQNKLFIPPYSKESKQLYESSIVYEENSSLTSYQSKPKVIVYLYSTMHKNVEINSGKKNLPETIDYYNKHKFGVDIVDQMMKAHSVKATSRRWPLSCFYNLLDMIFLNSYRIFIEVNKKKISRIDFLKELVIELIGSSSELITSNEPNNQNSNLVPSDLKLQTRKKCRIKSFCDDNKSYHLCINCRNCVCGNCSFAVCTNCK